MISTAELNKMKHQTRIVMQEAVKASQLFDAQFEIIVYQQMNKGECVNFKVLEALPLYDEFELPTAGTGKVLSVRHQNEGNDLIFKTRFSPGAILQRHEHDCLEEISVLSGWFDVVLGSEREGTFKTKRVHAGEIIVIPIDLDHQFTNGSKIEAKCHIKYIKP